jgi:taurine dioxygenase
MRLYCPTWLCEPEHDRFELDSGVTMSSNTMEVLPSGAPVGAEIRGVNLSGPLDDSTFARIRDAFDRYGVLVFRNQSLAPEKQIEFSRRFGELEVLPFSRFTLPGHAEVLLITNLKDGDRHIGIHDAGREWHADSTYVPNPSLASFLFAVEVPFDNEQALGDTLFVPTTGHFEEFDEGRQKLLSSLSSVHRMDARLVTKAGEQPPQAIHPVIVNHPRTGRKCLFVNEGRTVEFVGMDSDESRVLLRNLLEKLREPHRIYRHRWRVGDLLMWDNIGVQHQATHNYQWPKHRRLMHRTTVKGQPLC